MNEKQRWIYQQCVTGDQITLPETEFKSAFPKGADEITAFLLESAMQPEGVKIAFVSPTTFTVAN